MFYQVKKYLQFLFASSNQHGVHSPFVFDLVTKCLYDESSYPEYLTLDSYRNQLLKDDSVLNVTDYGAGSRIFQSNQREVSQIAKHAGASAKRMKLLFRLSNYFESKAILELGTSLGLGTISLALPQKGEVVSLEGCPEISKTAKDALCKANVQNARIVTGDFNHSIENLRTPHFDLIYFDGNHSKEATLTYFDKLLYSVHNDSVWVFDDIHWSPAMSEAWEIIKHHPKVTVTIDCFWLGFIFFRREQNTQHFKIRL